MTTRRDARLDTHDVCGLYGGLAMMGTCKNGGASLDDLDAEGDEDDDRLPVEPR